MKYLIASDIHGSSYYLEKIIALFNKEKCDKLFLLGDVYYHGPRNPLPKGYNPMAVADMLNQFNDSSLTVIKGNCDAEVDQMISKFNFCENYSFNHQNKIIRLTHGHKENIDELPNAQYDILIYGHFHIGFIKKIDDKIYANAGSISLPKNNSANSCLLVNEQLTLVDLEGNEIDSCPIA